MNTTDLRVQRTHMAIENALFNLLQRREFDDISVLDICAEAMINPKTFYKYYAGKSALVGELIKRFKNELRILQKQRLASSGEIFLKVSLPFFMQRQHILLALWKVKTKRHHLWQDMHEMIKQNFIIIAINKNPDKPKEYWDFQGEMSAVVLLNTLLYAFTHQHTSLPNVFEQLEEMLNVFRG